MKICIVKLSAMGDIIHAMVALQFIKKAHPDAHIDWVVESAFAGVLENNPHIDTILPVNLKAIKKQKSKIVEQYKLLKQYSQNNYDILIDAQGLLKSAIVSKLIGAKVIAGFDKDSIREGIASYFYDKKISIAYDANTIDRNVKVLCEPLDVSVTREDILKKEAFLFTSRTDGSFKKYPLTLVVGASRVNKIYPKEKFLELITLLKKETLVIWGNNEEYETAKWLEKKSPFVKVAPKGNLDDLKHLVHHSELLIGGDTGPTHMAWALNIPSITLFGNTPGYRNTYKTAINKIIESESKVDPLKLDKEDFSIQSIKPDLIATISTELLKDQSEYRRLQ
ncbi:MAG: lipopolysaccharide heptosyltransferase I [Sulfurimonas sp.]|jgi:heptosyltransferase-1|nr:lipopolysaccharide heptosyltransferase I [Sulfurimonas sp.]